MSWTAPKTWATGEMMTADLMNQQMRDNQTFLNNNLSNAKVAVLQDSKTANIGGGSATANAWTTRDLNTEQSDINSIVSISGNRFTPISGTYLIQARIPFQINVTLDQGAVRLYNFTAATQTLMGEGTRGDNTVQSINQSLNIWGIFTANGTDQYVVQYYTVSAFAASLGVANNRGTAEIYTQIMLMKIG